MNLSQCSLPLEHIRCRVPANGFGEVSISKFQFIGLISTDDAVIPSEPLEVLFVALSAPKQMGFKDLEKDQTPNSLGLLGCSSAKP